MSEKQYTYKHPHPAVTVDVAIFTVLGDDLKLLLVERGVEPFRGSWALPGGFVRMDESLHDAALRELAEETGLSSAYLEQIGAFGAPDRDPRERVISVAYSAVVSGNSLQLEAGSDATQAGWHSCSALPALAFDHEEIVQLARQRLAQSVRATPVALQFLPVEFTLSELQQVHELLLQEKIDKRNFRKWVMSLDYIEATGHKRTGGQHRPAALFTSTWIADSAAMPAFGAAPAPTAASDALDVKDAYARGYAAGADAMKTAVEDALSRAKSPERLIKPVATR